MLEFLGGVFVLIGVLNFAIPEGNRRGGLILIIVGIVLLGIGFQALGHHAGGSAEGQLEVKAPGNVVEAVRGFGVRTAASASQSVLADVQA